MIYLSLFFVSFVSATLFPMGSEGVLLYDISQHSSKVVALWLVATFGNSLGSVLNYLIGYQGEAFLERKGYLSATKRQRATVWFDHWGGWALLLSWMPIIGDPLTFVAGVLRYDFWRFVLIVFFAKGVRYALLIWLSSYYFGDVDFIKAIVKIFVKM